MLPVDPLMMPAGEMSCEFLPDKTKRRLSVALETVSVFTMTQESAVVMVVTLENET